MAHKKLYRRSAHEADRLLWASVAFGVLCGAFIAIVSGNWIVTAVVVSVPAYSLVRRVFKGPPVGVPILELAEDMLVLRHRLRTPTRVSVRKLRSVCYRSEDRRCYFFDFLDQDGAERSVGPFERMPGQQVVARWFADALPDLPFQAHESASAKTGKEPV